jgi:hypothetical protein
MEGKRGEDLLQKGFLNLIRKWNLKLKPPSTHLFFRNNTVQRMELCDKQPSNQRPPLPARTLAGWTLLCMS